MTSVRSALVAAGQHAAFASYSTGAVDVADALCRSRACMQVAATALQQLSRSDSTAGAALQAVQGIQTQLDEVARLASEMDPQAGQLPVGAVDSVFAGIEAAGDVLFSSRWG
jgi:hypothetical protein